MGLASVGGGSSWKYKEVLYVYIQFQLGYKYGPIQEHVSMLIKNILTKNNDENSLPGLPTIVSPTGYAGVAQFEDMSSCGMLKLNSNNKSDKASVTALSDLLCVYGAHKGTTYTNGQTFTLNSGLYGFVKV